MKRILRTLLTITIGLLSIGLPAGRALAQHQIHPAEASYQFNEARRHDLIARQLDFNYRMIYQAGFGPRFDAFEPWPRVPGDIYGYPGPQPIAQPLGYVSKQVSPTRWIYRPLDASDLISPAPRAVKPETPPANVQHPAPSDLDEIELPRPRPEVKRPPAHGPREF